MITVHSAAAQSAAEYVSRADGDSANEFVVRPGDYLEIQVFRETDLSGKYQVDPSGHITYPMLQDVSVADLRLDQVRDRLTEGLSKFLVNPQVTVSRAEGSTKSISVLGHVKEAGTFDFSPDLTVMRLISQAGGFLPSANKKKIRIVRTSGGGKEVMVVNATAIINGDAPDVELVAGDMVFVPESIF